MKNGKQFFIKDMDNQHLINFLKVLEKDGKYPDHLAIIRELLERILRKNNLII
jgi:hypothetical protein